MHHVASVSQEILLVRLYLPRALQLCLSASQRAVWVPVNEMGSDNPRTISVERNEDSFLVHSVATSPYSSSFATVGSSWAVTLLTLLSPIELPYGRWICDDRRLLILSAKMRQLRQHPPLLPWKVGFDVVKEPMGLARASLCLDPGSNSATEIFWLLMVACLSYVSAILWIRMTTAANLLSNVFGGAYLSRHRRLLTFAVGVYGKTSSNSPRAGSRQAAFSAAAGSTLLGQNTSPWIPSSRTCLVLNTFATQEENGEAALRTLSYYSGCVRAGSILVPVRDTMHGRPSPALSNLCPMRLWHVDIRGTAERGAQQCRHLQPRASPRSRKPIRPVDSIIFHASLLPRTYPISRVSASGTVQRLLAWRTRMRSVASFPASVPPVRDPGRHLRLTKIMIVDDVRVDAGRGDCGFPTRPVSPPQSHMDTIALAGSFFPGHSSSAESLYLPPRKRGKECLKSLSGFELVNGFRSTWSEKHVLRCAMPFVVRFGSQGSGDERERGKALQTPVYYTWIYRASRGWKRVDAGFAVAVISQSLVEVYLYDEQTVCLSVGSVRPSAERCIAITQRLSYFRATKTTVPVRERRHVAYIVYSELHRERNGAATCSALTWVAEHAREDGLGLGFPKERLGVIPGAVMLTSPYPCPPHRWLALSPGTLINREQQTSRSRERLFGIENACTRREDVHRRHDRQAFAVGWAHWHAGKRLALRRGVRK
ncbi:hypothetical protein GLOTRDRAFT_93817 [Gloeophyllum trabeum ATCC 11539]|uniref:Uncharacterized protein n=1 Tax=Gloeophyllum trabeum (strain ATCC 11539 / FP-39264 / Madison 617) TaxID=670483 RepID=S7Q756_GLOTA|nr:uncharacterized protein GLOTRDRAFT_93817 [Gloeophyllum trabeum ATCC 11539]EPQ55352.1 hypothetical protein GLOTRDRAFT_93817 [Gloeophyllum trabeum ATCC 11539]